MVHGTHWYVHSKRNDHLKLLIFLLQKVSDDENVALKRQLDELREQINHKDLDLKTHYRTIANLERQLNESENVCLSLKKKIK